MNTGKHPTEFEKARMVAAYRCGLSFRDAGRIAGFGHHVARGAVEESETLIRTDSERRSSHGEKMKARLEGLHLSARREAVRLYEEEKLSTPEIARRVGRSVSFCIRALTQAKVSRTYQGLRRYTIDEGYFSAITDEARAVWLGFIAADGHCANRALVITLARRDRGHLEKLRAALGSSALIEDFDGPPFDKSNLKKSHPASKLRIHSARLVSDLARHGLYGNKSARIVPWQGPEDLQVHWWRGLFEGDGHVIIDPTQATNNEVGLTGNEAMVRGFADFITKRTGDIPYIRQIPGAWQCRFASLGPAKRAAVVLYTGASVYLDRKKVLVDAMLAHQSKHHDWTAEMIEDALSRHGTVSGAAAEFGVVPDYLTIIRKQLGIYFDGRVKTPPYTANQLTALRDDLGSWAAVARHLGRYESEILRFRRRLNLH